MSDLVPLSHPTGDISTCVDAEHALKKIAVAEAAQDHFARAKDATKLFEAINAKLTNQAAYAVWRQHITIGHRPKKASQPREALPDADPGKDTISRWRDRLCVKDGKNRWRIDDAKLRATIDDTFRRCVRVCEQQKMGTVRGTEGTGEFERYTPAAYIDKAREVLGCIDLDPATSEHAQRTVQAETHFTAADDGLEREWHGRVWLNPPYHRELAPKFIDKLIAELAAGHVTEAIVLTNNSTDTAWFRSAASVCDAICFTSGRIHFEVPNADPVMPTQGQAFFYFGPNVDRFLDAYDEIGWCTLPASSDVVP